MQDIIIEKPYEFIGPHRGRGWPWIIQRLRLVDWYLRKYEGVVRHQLHGVDHLRESLRQGKGVLLTPNHCRYADPLVMGWVSRAAEMPLYSMASWHLFHQSRFQKWALRVLGAFSIYREGVDRQSLDQAVEILSSGERPLVLFPEGAVFRTNDQLQNLLDGVSFIARTAAKKRAKENREAGIVIHPVAIKYLFLGDLQHTLPPVLDEIERRMTWTHTEHWTIIDRLQRIIHALLSLKEIEHFGHAKQGDIVLRQQGLIDHLLHPLEQTWLGKTQEGAIIPRVKALRMKILPDLITGEVDTTERKRRWKHLADLYLAQQVASYPPNYLTHPTTSTRVLETVERIVEDLTDQSKPLGPLEVIIEVGEAIEVPTERGPRGEEDPVMVRLRDTMQGMLNKWSTHASPWKE